MEQQPGWWLASDGRWYPSEQGAYTAPQAAIGAFPSPEAARSGPWWLTDGATTPRKSKGPLVSCLIALAVLTVAAVTIPLVSSTSAGAASLQPPAGTVITWPGESNLPASLIPAGSVGSSVTDVGPPGDLVTPLTEQEVWQSVGSEFSTAFFLRDGPLLHHLLTRTAFESLAGNFACGCPAWPLQGAQVAFDAAPGQNSYPVSFVAEALATSEGQPANLFILFVKATAGAPWRVGMLGDNAGGAMIFDGVQPGLAPSVPTSVAAVARTFARYFQELDTTGSAQWPVGWLHDGVIDDGVTGSQQDFAYDRAHHRVEAFTHRILWTSSPVPVDEGAGEAPSMLGCFTMANTSEFANASGAPLVQSELREPLGQSVRPGSYASATTYSMIQACFQETATGTIVWRTNWGGQYYVQGNP